MWPRTSPATFTPGEKGNITPVCPSILSNDAQSLFHRGLPYLLSKECVDDPHLPPAAWLAAYEALTISNFQQSHLNALTTYPQSSTPPTSPGLRFSLIANRSPMMSVELAVWQCIALPRNCMTSFSFPSVSPPGLEHVHPASTGTCTCCLGLLFSRSPRGAS